MIHQFTDLDNIPLIFDKETEQIFFEKFIPNKKDICLTCGSKNIMNYPDLFICFNCKTKRTSENWTLKIINGYLAKTDGQKIVFFHRELMEAHLKKIPVNERINYHVHHIDGNKTNNCKNNLEIVEATEHFKHHQHLSTIKAYKTWSEKIYGDYCLDDHWEEFEEWLEEKREEY